MKTDLVDLKNKPPSKKEEMDGTKGMPTVGDYYEKYPYGLRINLNEDQIKKLDIDVSKLKAGSDISVAGKGSVIRVWSEDSSEGGESRSIEIQIKELALSNESDFAEGFARGSK